MIPAAIVAGLILILAACTQNQQQATTSPTPEASPSPSPVTSPRTTPSPVESPLPDSSPTPPALPSPAKLIIASLPFHVGEVGITYAPVALRASGGTPPYRWSIATGALPTGLTLSSGGSATGKPTTSGAFSFVIRLDDSAGGAAGASRTISVVPHLSATGICSKVCFAEEGCSTVCGKLGSQSGGVGPFKYKANILPTGMGLNGLSLTGAIPPPPQICDCSFWQLTVTVTDAFGATDTVDALIRVFSHIAISGPGPICQGFGCTTTLFYSGGDGSTPTVIVGSVNCTSGCSGANGELPPNTLPPGFSATANGGTITVTFPGGTWVGTFDLTIYDQSLCSPQGFCVSNTVTQAADVNAG